MRLERAMGTLKMLVAKASFSKVSNVKKVMPINHLDVLVTNQHLVVASFFG